MNANNELKELITHILYLIFKKMTIDECYLIGKITKTHGLKGELSILLDVDFTEDYEELESVFLETKGGVLIPHFVEEIQIKENKQIIKFEGIDKLEQALPLVGNKLYLPLETLPELTTEEEFYFHEIIGFQVIDQNQGKLGTVESVYQFPQQNIISMSYQGKEVMIPLNDDIVLKINRENKELFTNLPDGLLEVYLAP
jgi:16S rRNA processing protein RimM